jgi:uncharacterized protein
MGKAVSLKENLDYLIRGACFLASGGGGRLEMAADIKEAILKGPKDVLMVDLEDLSNDVSICMVAGVGAPSAAAKFLDSPRRSFEALEKEAQKELEYVIPLETGAVNSLIPLLVAAWSDENVRLVNADGGGRAFPQIKMSSFALSPISCNPAVVAVEDSMETHIYHENDPQKLEDEIRGHAASGPSALASFVMNGAQVKKPGVSVASALQKAIDLGKAFDLPSHTERIQKIAEILKGRKVKPLIVNGKFTDRGPSIYDPYFDVRTVTLTGEGPLGPEVEICFVNESIAVRVEKQPIAMAPSMFCYLTTEGKPFTNAEVMKDWDRWMDIPVTLTMIDPAPEIAIHYEVETVFFQDLYNTYFLKGS